jgi:UDP-N-acetylglucosamine enolpyruvyl transferase
VDSSKSTGGLKLQIGDTAKSYNQLTVSIRDIHTDSLDISGVDISTQAGATAAIDKIKASTPCLLSVATWALSRTVWSTPRTTCPS